jgi:(R,R)-butanediol dehydrogenase/meso-butanediol dehydrogenase/diacetyl reductase
MLASRLHGLEDIRLDTVDDPNPGEGEVRVKVAHNGICGSDLHMYFRESPWRSGHPITLGHEFCGVVDGLGSGVSGVELGTRVAVRPFYKCGGCARCKRGLEHLCTPMKVLGCGAEGGGLAEYCVMDAGMVFVLPDAVTLEQGALVEPMAVSFNGVLRGDVEPGMRTVVFGAGPIGVGVMLGLRAKGIDDVVVVEPSAVRRETIAALGATEVLDPTTDDVRDAVMSRTGGEGADVVFECAGAAASFSAAVPLVTARGKLVVVAVYEDELSWNPTQMMINEIELRGSMGYEMGVYETVIELMDQGHYPTTGWVEHIPWSAVVEEGFEPLRRGERMKVMVDVGV